METLNFKQIVKLQQNICLYAIRSDLEQIEGIVKDSPFVIDPTSFTEQELIGLGFSLWDDNVYLIPAWMYNFLLDGVEFTDINLKKEIFKKGETDEDARCGSLAFGVVIRKQ